MTYLVLGESAVADYTLFAHMDTRYIIGGKFVASQQNAKYTIYNLDASGQIIYQKAIQIGSSTGTYDFLCEHTPVQKTQSIKISFTGGSVIELYYVETEDPGGSDPITVVIESGPKPEVYDLIGRRLAILKDAYSLHVEYELDTWPTLKFSLPKDSPHWAYVVNEMRILYEDELYVIKQTGAKRDNNNAILQEVTCPSIASDLNYKYNQVIGTYVEKELVPTVATASLHMDTILTNSGWSKGTVTVESGKQRALQSEWESVASNLQELKTKFGGFLVFRPQVRQVDLLEEPGEDNGVFIEYGKNLLGIEKTSDSAEFITRLYGYGSEDDNGIELTFNSVNLQNPGQPYVQNFSYFLARGYTQQQIDQDIATNGEASVFLKISRFSDSDYVDAQALYDDTKAKLDDELCMPKVTYKISLVDLSKISGFEQESFALGDWVTVRDTELGVDIKTRIMKFVYYPGYPEKTSVELSNTKETIGDVLATTLTFSGQARKNGNLRSMMRNVINTFATSINGTTGKLKWSDDIIEAIATDAQGNETGLRTRMTPGGFGVSEDGGQTYTSAMTGQGVLANTIVANAVHILDIESDGITIQGGTNGVELNSSLGLAVTRTDKKSRSLLNATYGIAIQKGDGTGGNWVDQFWVDTAGILHAERLESKGLIIRDTNGMLMIDAQNSKIDLSTFATVVVGGKITYVDVGALSDDTFIPDSSYITTITYNTVTTSYVNALAVTSRRLTAQNVYGTTLLDGYGDTMGGVLKIYDNNGYLNLKAGVESGQTDNAGGTLILYKDSPFATYPSSFSYQRVEMGIVTGYGLVQCKSDNGVVRVSMYADSNIGPYLGVWDTNGSLKSYITETDGYINGQKILTGSSVIAKFA